MLSHSVSVMFLIAHGQIALLDLKMSTMGRGLRHGMAIWCSSTTSAAAQTVISCTGVWNSNASVVQYIH